MDSEKFITPIIIAVLFALIASGLTGVGFATSLVSSFSKPLFLGIIVLLVAAPWLFHEYQLYIQIACVAALLWLLITGGG